MTKQKENDKPKAEGTQPLRRPNFGGTLTLNGIKKKKKK